MSWDYRVVQKRIADEVEPNLCIVECFYNKKGEITGYTKDAPGLWGDSIEELRQGLKWMEEALDKPILIDGEVEFADWDEDDD